MVSPGANAELTIARESSSRPDVRPADLLAWPVIKVEIRRQLAAIRAGHAYLGADHAAETVVNEPGLRVVLIALKDGGRLPEHPAHASITVQALEVWSTSPRLTAPWT